MTPKAPFYPASNRPTKNDAARDKRYPCAVCGWSKHMAVHQFPKGTKSLPPFYAHEYQPIKEQA
jgi:hypothetical protein